MARISRHVSQRLHRLPQATAAEARAAKLQAAAEAADAARDEAEAALEAAMERIVAAERKASEVSIMAFVTDLSRMALAAHRR